MSYFIFSFDIIYRSIFVSVLSISSSMQAIKMVLVGDAAAEKTTLLVSPFPLPHLPFYFLGFFSHFLILLLPPSLLIITDRYLTQLIHILENMYLLFLVCLNSIRPLHPTLILSSTFPLLSGSPSYVILVIVSLF